jgi:glycine oxidase
VVIIGGGVIGCSIAYHLAKQGVTSQIIEKDAIASQASGKAWAVFPSPGALVFFEGISVPEGSVRPFLNLCEEGFRRLPQNVAQLEEEGGVDIGYSELPSLRLAFSESEEKQYKERMSILQREGFDIGWLDRGEVITRVPDIASGVIGSLIFPQYQVEPYQFTLALAQAAEKRGVDIRQGEVVGFDSGKTRVNAVTLATGTTIEADAVVLAMGPWTGQGTSWLGNEILIKVEREQCLRVEIAQNLPFYRLSTMDSTIIPKVNGTVVLGRALQPEEAADFNDTPTQEGMMKLIEAAVGLVPRLEEAKVIEHRVGLEAWPPIGLQPVLGQLSGWDNVYVAARLQTMGVIMSLAVGRIMADLIVKGQIESSVDHLSPARIMC